jgi:hypothetical protein
MAKPARGKARVKVVRNPKTGRTKRISYGQAGRAKGGGPRVKTGTPKGDAYCSRSYGIKQEMLKKGGASAKKARDPNSPNNLSRKRWRCRGKKSVK